MNCRSFRRHLLIDPRHLDASLRDHAARCSSCAQALERALAFERRLANAVRREYEEVADGERRDGADHDPGHNPGPDQRSV
ncbi:hypothetical protein Thiowin_02560 [Thiorhodovibrio winogradskyi]|uniref:Zinc-finger domain-containing protein n=1 Tax=Thiorhodovibrio winogradskyi TaxID=77007 RepID=A0ABZ0SAF8_9GAMM|nr:hypothetical protein [Thiorhodovibrio winogradskyi]